MRATEKGQDTHTYRVPHSARVSCVCRYLVVRCTYTSTVRIRTRLARRGSDATVYRVEGKRDERTRSRSAEKSKVPLRQSNPASRVPLALRSTSACRNSASGTLRSRPHIKSRVLDTTPQHVPAVSCALTCSRARGWQRLGGDARIARYERNIVVKAHDGRRELGTAKLYSGAPGGLIVGEEAVGRQAHGLERARLCPIRVGCSGWVILRASGSGDSECNGTCVRCGKACDLMSAVACANACTNASHRQSAVAAGCSANGAPSPSRKLFALRPPRRWNPRNSQRTLRPLPTAPVLWHRARCYGGDA